MKFSVPDMSCGHCKAAIEKAAKSVDAGSAPEIDLNDRTVVVQSVQPADKFSAAFKEEGYSSELVEA